MSKETENSGNTNREKVTSKNCERLTVESDDKEMDSLRRWFTDKLALRLGNITEKPKVLSSLDLDGIVDYIKSSKAQNIITMAGAGISTSAGIPDFRSPSSGLYQNLSGYNLPHPEAMFDINYFKKHPEPFFALVKELSPNKYKPTPCHFFLRLLNQNGLLLRHYTQNVDALEHDAGLPADKIVEAHGTFHTAHCLNTSCAKEYTRQWITDKVQVEKVPRCESCDSVVKPDVVFFGEALPKKFRLVEEDFPRCDLLIILGTSLVVQPFASLVDRVPPRCPRLLINFEEAGTSNPIEVVLGMSCGLQFHGSDNFRDVAWLGSCDEGCRLLARKLGWEEELDKLIKSISNKDESFSKEQSSRE